MPLSECELNYGACNEMAEKFRSISFALAGDSVGVHRTPYIDTRRVASVNKRMFPNA